VIQEPASLREELAGIARRMAAAYGAGAPHPVDAKRQLAASEY